MTAVKTISILLAAASVAAACPVCYTDTGDAVRQGIFNGDFGLNVLFTLVPFVFFYGLAAMVYFGVPSRSRKLTLEQAQTPSGPERAE